MAYLKELISQLPDLSRRPELSPPERLSAARLDVTRMLGKIAPREPAPYDLVETYEVLRQVQPSALAMMQLPAKHLKRAPWVMFEPLREGEPELAESRAFVTALIGALEQKMFGPAIVNLAVVFLRAYPRRASYFGVLRKEIGRLVGRLDTPKGRVLQERAAKYRFFTNDGPRTLGVRLLHSEDPASELVDAGFDSGGMQQGFVIAAVEQTLLALSYELERDKLGDTALQSLLGFLEIEGQSPDGLRFPLLRGELADALLLPFASRAPRALIEAGIREFLLRNYNDPRINRGNWGVVSEKAITVFMRWLVHATLADFFRVVRKGSEQDPDADRMWPYREAFWSAYLAKGAISDAWVVLGEAIAIQSRQFLANMGGSYGRLGKGLNVKPTHAVLILRIGDLIITEWNHSGKYRVWHADNEKAPKLYKSKGTYSRFELTSSPDFDGSHHGASTGGWQERLASLIAEWTGVRVGYREYMP